MQKTRVTHSGRGIGIRRPFFTRHIFVIVNLSILPEIIGRIVFVFFFFFCEDAVTLCIIGYTYLNFLSSLVVARNS